MLKPALTSTIYLWNLEQLIMQEKGASPRECVRDTWENLTVCSKEGYHAYSDVQFTVFVCSNLRGENI